jgi:hypothetical protein
MVAATRVSEEKLVELIRSGMPMTDILKHCHYRSVASTVRVKDVARRHGLTIFDPREAINAFQRKLQHNARKPLQVDNGIVLIGSDAHYWPNIITTAHRAFCKFATELKPVAVIMNGDGFDGASISRFPRIGWDTRPTVMEELTACVERMGEIEAAARTKQLFWPLGNHDSRYETFLAAHAPEFQGITGFHLKDKFPLWIPCWSVWINENTVVKHRFRSGINAAHSNAMWAGKHMVTGHLHSPKVAPISDYNGIRWGVDCGTLADPYGPQFVDYTEDNPVNWASAFAVLTYYKGQLLWPDLCHVIGDGLVSFRGEVMEV